VPDIPELTGEQRAVVDRPTDDKLSVTAGPGAGKTHTLVARIARLIEGDSDVASREMLSLSFSRAAVGELRRRIGGRADRSSRVQSATFDSFATRILERDGRSELDGLGYDQRIELATTLLGDRVPDDLAEIQHVFVDESQDLIGIRADFVLALLTATGCGFTVFADDAQAIFDFTGEATAGPSFTERLDETFTGSLVHLRLLENHRTNDRQLLAISSLGDSIRASDADRHSATTSFENVLRDLHAAGAVANVAPILQTARSTAILTRRNSEALAVSAALYDAGIPHRLRRRADDPVIGDWLSRLQNVDGLRRITISDLEDHSSSLPWDPSITWSALCRVARPRRGVVNLDQAAEHLAGRTPPDELVDSATSGVVVSTIHRAKGLEFDSVLLVPFKFDTDTWLAELRVLYVGLTRARHDLMLLNRVDDGRWNFLPYAGRWRRIGFAGKHRYTAGIEICGSDVATFDATGRDDLPIGARDVTEYLQSSVAVGDPVVLRLRSSSADACGYDVTHNGQWVAATTPAFGELVAQRLDLRKAPTEIHGARVEIVSTSALPRMVTDRYDTPYRFVPNCRIHGVGTW
jgi:superfamily I DNA/RNA helicase